jgi:hypothetical protein
MKEIWKPIVGYEGRYEISNLGNVASLKYARGSNRRLLKQSTNTWGYSQVTLSKDKEKCNKTVHRLVAEAFIENPNKHKQINHIDENKHNNRVDNLEWCDSKHNMNYGNRTAKASNSKKKPVIATLPDGTEEYYESIKDAAEILHLSHSTISASLHKKWRHKRAKGREWRFANEYRDKN